MCILLAKEFNSSCWSSQIVNTSSLSPPQQSSRCRAQPGIHHWSSACDQGVSMCFHRQSSARRWRVHYTIRPFLQCSAVRLLQRSSSPHASASVNSPFQYESPCPCDVNCGGGFLASSIAHPLWVGRLREQKHHSPSSSLDCVAAKEVHAGRRGSPLGAATSSTLGCLLRTYFLPV
jgi:hypothetical protein